MLPAKPLKELYDSLREDPKWYLREELVEDCKGRGGCCARECGCCEKRQATPGYTKGIGHCSVTCGCCIETRGFELTEQEEDMFHDNLHDMLWDENPAYLLKMTEAFFSKPESKPKINANENPESQSVGTRPPSYSE